MTDTNITDTATLPQFSETERRAANELHSTVITAEATGARARVTQALALWDLHRTDGYMAVDSALTGEPYPSWRQYILENVPSMSEAAVSKAEKVASLLGNSPQDELAKAGIEKLYMGLLLSDRGAWKLDQVVANAQNHTLLELRALLQGGAKTDDNKRYPLTEFTVPKAAQDRFGGVLQTYRTALKQSDNGGEPSDWQVLDALIETNATLDPAYILETVSGKGGNKPRQAVTFTDTPPEEVTTWVVRQYIENGHEPDQLYDVIHNAIKGQIEAAKDELEVRRRQEEADQEEAAREAKKVVANKNKLIKLSASFKIEGSDGSTYMVVDVFKDANNAHVKPINESKTPAFQLPPDGTLVNLDDLAAIMVNAEKVKPEKKPTPAPDASKFSKQAQANKGKGTKAKTASKPKGSSKGTTTA